MKESTIERMKKMERVRVRVSILSVGERGRERGRERRVIKYVCIKRKEKDIFQSVTNECKTRTKNREREINIVCGEKKEREGEREK